MLSTLLSLTVMKCFRRVVEAHIKDSFNFTVDSHLQGYRKKRFTDCSWLRLRCKKSQPELPPLQFGPGLLNQQNISSSCIILSTGSSQISVLNLTFQVTLLTYDARAKHQSCHTVFVDDATLCTKHFYVFILPIDYFSLH